jgi:hypothetical protein
MQYLLRCRSDDMPIGKLNRDSTAKVDGMPTGCSDEDDLAVHFVRSRAIKKREQPTRYFVRRSSDGDDDSAGGQAGSDILACQF